jgi:multiple sugar transport system permease protein
MDTARASIRQRPSPWYRRRSTREAMKGYGFILPWVVGFLLFTAGPMLASLYLSLTRYSIAQPPQFVGLVNYSRAFAGDPIFWPSLLRTGMYALLAVPLGIAGSLFVAALLNEDIVGKAVYRTLFFIPTLTPIVASGILWTWLLQPEVGLVNFALWQVGIDGPGWLASPSWALPCVVAISLWGRSGEGGW